MAYWKTKSNSFTLNINERLIRAMKNKGARFCKMSDNGDIDNENSSWWTDHTAEETDENQSDETQSKENQSKETDENQSEETHRILKPNITVKTVDGDYVTGYITHWVRGPCSGTDEKNWFIIQPGRYPTSYTYNNEIIVEDM
jgi:hypothetical protein